jgi:hypothetical protein
VQAKPLDPLLSLIREGEGDYNSVNAGVAGDTPGGWPDLQRMTVAQVKIAQAKQHFFAVGAYQFIPTTLPMAQSAAQVGDNEPFNAATQDRLAVGLLLGGKRPVLRDYLLGKHDRLNDAQLDLAREWASMPMADGHGVYDGDSGGNRATAKVAKVQAALITARQGLLGETHISPLSKPVVTSPKPKAGEPQYYSQRDSVQADQRQRMCFSSSCAMLLKARKPNALLGSNADDEYLQVVQRFGDTTDYGAQLKALKHFGLNAQLVQNGDFNLIEREVKEHGGLCLGYIHRGGLDSLRGSGHWLYCWGINQSHIIAHDPWGNLNMVTGSDDSGSGRAVHYSRKNFGQRWMVVQTGSGWRYADGNGFAIVAD